MIRFDLVCRKYFINEMEAVKWGKEMMKPIKSIIVSKKLSSKQGNKKSILIKKIQVLILL